MNKKKLSLLFFVSLFFLASFACLPAGIVSAQIKPPPGIPDNFDALLLNIGKGVGTIIASLGALMIVVAGILFLISAGAPAKVETAKKALFYAILGIVIGGSASAIIGEIQKIVGK